MRIGLLGDTHWMTEPPASQAAWHGGGEFAGVLDRLDAALEHFAAEEVDCVVVSGDLSHRGDRESLEQVLRALRTAAAPVVVVAGNHDVGEDPDGLARALQAVGDPNLSLVGPEGGELAGIKLAGVQVGEAEAWFGARLREHPSVEALGAGPVVFVSHYPVLSLAVPVAAAGLPYPGDLLDREELATTLLRRPAPTVVIGGHVHARAAIAEGVVLQLSVGAVVEPPFECAVIDVEADSDGGLSVRRRCIRLLASAARLEPVFSPEDETWRFGAGSWQSTGAALENVPAP